MTSTAQHQHPVPNKAAVESKHSIPLTPRRQIAFLLREAKADNRMEAEPGEGDQQEWFFALADAVLALPTLRTALTEAQAGVAAETEALVAAVEALNVPVPAPCHDWSSYGDGYETAQKEIIALIRARAPTTDALAAHETALKAEIATLREAGRFGLRFAEQRFIEEGGYVSEGERIAHRQAREALDCTDAYIGPDQIRSDCKPNAAITAHDAAKDVVIAALRECEAACREFVRKVEVGEAKSTRSYQTMKAALANVEAALAATTPAEARGETGR